MGCKSSSLPLQDAEIDVWVPESVISPWDTLIHQFWAEIDSHNLGFITLKQCHLLFSALNVNITAKDLKIRFKHFNIRSDGRLSKSEFMQLLNTCQSFPGEALSSIFAKFDTGKTGWWTVHDLADFLTSEQGISPLAATQQAGTLINSIKQSILTKQGPKLRAAPQSDGQEDPAAAAAAGDAPCNSVAAAATASEAGGIGTSDLVNATPAIFHESPSSGAAAGSGSTLAVALPQLDTHGTPAAPETPATLAWQPTAMPADALSFIEFALLMTSTSLNGLQRPASALTGDMSQPLASYWICASHNTYLVGNQLTSKSKAGAIQRALRLGCRVVELDCYDSRAGPAVTHGGTMTSTISFQDAIQAIADAAFDPSNTRPSMAPVIITLENHCSLAGQAQQAQILQDTLGDALYIPSGPRPTEFPSPAELRGKFLIRCKPRAHARAVIPGPTAALPAQPADADAEEGGSESDHVDVGSAPGPPAAQAGLSVPMAPCGSTGQAQPSTSADSAASVHGTPPVSAALTHPGLLRLFALCNIKLPGLGDAHAIPSWASTSSVNEDKAAKLGSQHGQALQAYTQTHILRIYPRGSRVDSSNFDPAPFWAAGAQMVALNYQTRSPPVWKSQVLFSAGGGSGYVLKPPHLRGAGPQPGWYPAWWPASPVPPLPCSAASTAARLRVHVRVLSAHYLPKPKGAARGDNIDPYIVLHASGAAADCMTARTSTVADNGFNPAWRADDAQLSVEFKVPEVGLLLFTVMDEDKGKQDTFIAYGGVPVPELQLGWRAVPLHDAASVPIAGAFLFVHVAVECLDA